MPLNMLNEICKASAIKATSALSKFLDTPLGFDMKPVEINKVDDITRVKDHDENTVNMYLPITGNLSGASIFHYSEKSALSLCDVLFKRSAGSTKTISEPEISALSEVTNVMIGNFLTLFARSLQLESVMHRSAIFEFAPFNKIFDKELALLTDGGEQSLVKIGFSFKHLNIKGSVFILLTEDKILNVLKNMSAIPKV